MKNVPNLRFKEFSGEWKTCLLGKSIVLYDKDRKPIKEQERISGEYAYYGATGIIDYIDDYIFEGEYLLLGEDGANIVTRSAPLIYKTSGKFWVNNHAHIFKPKKDFNIDFMKQRLELINYVPYNTGTAQPKLNADSIKSIPFKAPEKEEQEKIASFFSLIDKKIELQTEKVEELKNYKKGIMQKIFSQELRFKDENGNEYLEWEISTIEKIANLEKGFTPDTKDEESWIGDIPWLSIADMKQGKYVANVSKYISNKALGKKHLVPTGTLIMSFKLTIGRLAIVEEPLMTNEAICHFYWKNSNINTEYMYYYLNSVNVESFGCRAAKGITLNNDSLNSIVVKIPVIQEQKKISELLMSVDKKIEKEQEKLERLKQYKQGLLQQMFI